MEWVKDGRFGRTLEISADQVHSFVEKTDLNPWHRKSVPVVPGLLLEAEALELYRERCGNPGKMTTYFHDFFRAGKHAICIELEEGPRSTVRFFKEGETASSVCCEFSGKPSRGPKVHPGPYQVHLEDIMGGVDEAGFEFPGISALAYASMIYSRGLEEKDVQFANLQNARGAMYHSHSIEFCESFFHLFGEETLFYLPIAKEPIQEGRVTTHKHIISCSYDGEEVFSGTFILKTNGKSEVKI